MTMKVRVIKSSKMVIGQSKLKNMTIRLCLIVFFYSHLDIDIVEYMFKI